MIICPELKDVLSVTAAITTKLRQEITALANKANKANKSSLDFEAHLKLQFDSIDEDHSGFLDKSEFLAKLRDLGIDMPQNSLDMLFSAIVKSDEDRAANKISFEEYVALVCPEKVVLKRAALSSVAATGDGYGISVDEPVVDGVGKIMQQDKRGEKLPTEEEKKDDLKLGADFGSVGYLGTLMSFMAPIPSSSPRAATAATTITTTTAATANSSAAASNASKTEGTNTHEEMGNRNFHLTDLFDFVSFGSFSSGALPSHAQAVTRYVNENT